ncbi:MAG: hypothetical protein ABIH23_08990 [bacterium]
MFQIKINTVPVVFSKFFSANDTTAVLEALPADAKKVLFVDTGATPDLAATIQSLVEKGISVTIRDHHKGEGRNPEAADTIEQILGDNAKIVDRKTAPGCAILIELGEFSDADVIIADPDYDGLVAAMKAAGVSYEGMDGDAEVFDVRPKQSAETLTSLGWTAVRALATLPPFNKERPEVSENAKRDLFEAFVKAASGDTEALENLEGRVAEYEAGVAEAERLLAEKMSHPCKGVAIIDSVGANRSDLNTLTRGMEKTGAVVTGTRKDFGPIAGKPGGHGVQISIAVAQSYQKELDLRTLVPEGMESSPQAGLLSNVSFLLHCSEAVWESTILPALRARFG